MDVSRAQIANLGGEEVSIEDPQHPLRVRVEMFGDRDKPAVRRMTVESRDGTAITSTLLTEIPVRQIAGVAASVLRVESDAHYRMLAQPLESGQRSWPPEHFARVQRVAAWARATGRPGGAAAAIADFWDVHPRTARRWIAQASQ